MPKFWEKIFAAHLPKKKDCFPEYTKNTINLIEKWTNTISNQFTETENLEFGKHKLTFNLISKNKVILRYKVSQ